MSDGYNPWHTANALGPDVDARVDGGPHACGFLP